MANGSACHRQGWGGVGWMAVVTALLMDFALNLCCCLYGARFAPNYVDILHRPKEETRHTQGDESYFGTAWPRAR